MDTKKKLIILVRDKVKSNDKSYHLETSGFTCRQRNFDNVGDKHFTKAFPFHLHR